ncbi:vitamin K epoxide reductase family protein, partial [Candidatus Woesearchaeota archaeon]|nr:vitamin K epoxide reductase family protein [Candidatus Woesearchaeota archaeon]
GMKPAGAEHRITGQSDRIEAVMKVILFLAIVGFLISLYMVWLHYRPSGISFCSINEKFDCAEVAKSSYSSMLGVPVALIGVFGYVAIAVISCFLIFRDVRKYPSLNVRLLNRIVLVLAAGGFLFSVYLTIVQEFLIGVWCVMCISSAIVITAIFILAIISQSYCMRCRQKLKQRGVEPAKHCRYC